MMKLRSFNLAVAGCFAFFCMALFATAQDKPEAQAGDGANETPKETVLVNGVQEPVYRVHTGIKAPTIVTNPGPEYSDEARRERVEGVVTLAVIVTSAGDVATVRVIKSLGHGLDEKAMEAVRQWKFKPATKDGVPVSVQIAIETSFHVYHPK